MPGMRRKVTLIKLKIFRSERREKKREEDFSVKRQLDLETKVSRTREL